MEIVLTGVGKPASEVLRGEMPAVWFTTRNTFEPTAFKGIMGRGGRRTASLSEMERVGNGLARVGVRADLVPADWNHHMRASGISRKTARRLARAARQVGSDPREWRVHYAAVPRSMWSRVQIWKGREWV